MLNSKFSQFELLHSVLDNAGPSCSCFFTAKWFKVSAEIFSCFPSCSSESWALWCCGLLTIVHRRKRDTRTGNFVDDTGQFPAQIRSVVRTRSENIPEKLRLITAWCWAVTGKKLTQEKILFSVLRTWLRDEGFHIIRYVIQPAYRKLKHFVRDVSALARFTEVPSWWWGPWIGKSRTNLLQSTC